MKKKRQQKPQPLDLLFMLADSCMDRLSPNAWKLVSYIAARHLRVHPEWLMSVRDPAFHALGRDLESGGVLLPSEDTGAYPYRAHSEAPFVPGFGRGRFAVISLKELCQGKQIERRWRDRGTGLSKSSVAKALRESVQSGILIHKRNKSEGGRDKASYYAIDWDCVQRKDWERSKGPKGGAKRPKKGVRILDTN